MRGLKVAVLLLVLTFIPGMANAFTNDVYHYTWDALEESRSMVEEGEQLTQKYNVYAREQLNDNFYYTHSSVAKDGRAEIDHGDHTSDYRGGYFYYEPGFEGNDINTEQKNPVYALD